MKFELAPQLAADTQRIGALELCDVLLMKDSQYPWLILVPRVPQIIEVYQLSTEQQQQLQEETSAVGEAIMNLFRGNKLNIGALGNMVPQLHVHLIVRFRGDPAWPAPVWGANPRTAYAPAVLAATVEQIQQCLSGIPSFTPA